MTHKIKIDEPYADAIVDGRKAFEIRRNDRGYNAGDKVEFTVIDGCMRIPHYLNGKVYDITYVHSGLGLENGYVVFGIKPQAESEE